MIRWVKSNRERRRGDRFPVSDGAPSLPIAVERRNSDSTLGQLIDLSQQGAKLCLDSVLQFSEDVILRLALPTDDLSLSINSTIVWTRAAADGRFMVGCSFDKAIPANVIDRFAGLGLINRRRHARFATNIEAEARWQLSTTTIPVTILDYSDGGFRIAYQCDEDMSHRVRLQFATGETAFGVVKWNRRTGDTAECGCEFLSGMQDADGASIIRRLAENPIDAEPIA